MQSTNRFALIKFTARYWLTHLHFKFSKDLVLDYNMLICGTIVRRIIIDFKRNTKNMSNIVFSVEIEFNNYSPHSPHQRISTRFQGRLYSVNKSLLYILPHLLEGRTLFVSISGGNCSCFWNSDPEKLVPSLCTQLTKSILNLMWKTLILINTSKPGHCQKLSIIFREIVRLDQTPNAYKLWSDMGILFGKLRLS